MKSTLSILVIMGLFACSTAPSHQPGNSNEDRGPASDNARIVCQGSSGPETIMIKHNALVINAGTKFNLSKNLRDFFLTTDPSIQQRSAQLTVSDLTDLFNSDLSMKVDGSWTGQRSNISFTVFDKNNGELMNKRACIYSPPVMTSN